MVNFKLSFKVNCAISVPLNYSSSLHNFERVINSPLDVFHLKLSLFIESRKTMRVFSDPFAKDLFNQVTSDFLT